MTCKIIFLRGFDSLPDLKKWEYSSTGLEWWPPKPQVIGSNPIAPANFNSHFKLLIMVREYIIETLTKIKEYDEKIHSIYRMGIDLLDFDNLIPQLEKSIPTLLRKEKDEYYGYITDVVGWWLYDDVDKIIYIDGDVEITLDNIEDFVDYLITEYASTNTTI